jgi:hypothetical protein
MYGPKNNKKTKQTSLNKFRNKPVTISLFPHARGSLTDVTSTVYRSMRSDNGYFRIERK